MKKFNGGALLQAVILAAFALAFAVLLITGQIKSYVHPRIEKYAWFAVAALLLMAVSMIPMVRKPRRHNRWLPSFLLIIPLLTGFTLPAAVNTGTLQINNSLLPKAGSAAAASSAPADSSPYSTTEPAVSSPPAISGNSTAPSAAVTEPDSAITESNGVIEVGDDAFLKWLTQVSEDLSAYKGKTVTLKGFVYREDSFASNEFVPARMSMVCCAADISACGFLCRSDDAQKWATNSWVRVTATIDEEYNEEYKDYQPVLKATKIEPAEKPKNEIVYPY